VFQGLLDVVLEVFGSAVGAVTCQYSAVSSHQELGEVPLNSAGTQKAPAGPFQLAVNGVGVGAIHFDLREHREGDGIVLGTESRNGVFGSRLLTAKLVAGKTEYREAAGVPALVKCFEAPVLGRIATATCGVDNEECFASKVFEIGFCAIDARNFRCVVDLQCVLDSRVDLGYCDEL